MSFTHMPYVLLGLASFTAIAGFRLMTSVMMVAACLAALAFARIECLAVPSIILCFGPLWMAERKLVRPALRAALYVGFGAMAVLLSQHLLPGFNNLIVFERVRFAEDSTPFTMYLNFDKPLVGLGILLFFIKREQSSWTAKKVLLTLTCWAVLTSLLMVLALATGYVRFDFKWPEHAWLWALNNFFFVCLTEEGLFRGFIQGGLQRLLPKSHRYSVLALSIASILFGLAHFRGGLTYVLLSTIAGFAYGYTYWKTQRLEAAMFVHFGLNFVHFVAFSYPTLARADL